MDEKEAIKTLFSMVRQLSEEHLRLAEAIQKLSGVADDVANTAGYLNKEVEARQSLEAQFDILSERVLNLELGLTGDSD